MPLRRSSALRHSVVSCATAPAADRHAARSLGTFRAHAPPHNAAAQGSEVSRSHVLQDLLLQRQLRHQTLQLGVLPLQLFHSLRLIQLQAAVLFSPAVVGLHRDFRFFAGLRRGLPVRNFYFHLPQQRHDLLRLVSPHRHVQLLYRVILSHSRWTNSSRSRQYDAENRMTTTAGITYSYDGDGRRVQKSGGKIYWYGISSDPLFETDLAG